MIAITVATIVSLYCHVQARTVTEGVVAYKIFEPQETNVSTSTTENGRSTSTSIKTSPEAYRVGVQGTNANGKVCIRWVNVSKECYTELQSGAHVTVDSLY